MSRIRAHFDGKVIVPDEPVDLQPGQQVVLDVEAVRVDQVDPLPELAEGQDVFDWMIKNAIGDPSLPTDLSANLEHYLYGVPKQKP
jgi:hypothetical protein